ncbi:hypothetical protein KP509_26G017500 [Ceratopteris richardii]|uniref:Glutaredoxin domain-containing protein n=2 Tax=Ceratopteris richardii TaxID=49495 RepID=A0A8T2RKF0_CERRI|nr:hypothetical protein KP509_26G017500 [Ceratopteris richardii]
MLPPSFTASFTRAAMNNPTRGGGFNTAAAAISLDPPSNSGAEWSKREPSKGAAGGNPVVVVTRPGCCMSHTVTRLLCSLGVSPQVIEISSSESVAYEQREEVPTIFIGGRLLGGVDKLLAAHINGSLVPQLKEAGALWL